MRKDLIGFFWEDRDTHLRLKPPIIDNGWRPVKDFPNLSTAKRISFDTEVYDPDLKKSGPGWATGKGEVLGVSIAVDEDAWYFPLAHKEQSEYNYDRIGLIRFLKDTFKTPFIQKIGANITYDIGWLSTLGVEVYGTLYDVLMAESILYPGYINNLDRIAATRLGENKETNDLYNWLRSYTGSKKEDLREFMYMAPASYVGKYAIMDAVLPLKIHDQQLTEFERDSKLWQVYRLECGLIPLMIKMRKQGTYVDLDKAYQLKLKLQDDIAKSEQFIFNEYGSLPNINSGRSLARLFDRVGLKYPITTSGNPSFTAEFLKSSDHPLHTHILNIRKWQKLIGTFIDGYIFGTSVDGKIYTTFHQLKSDENGAITGRFSSSNPNLQNIPSKGELGKMTRAIFIPAPNGIQWRKYDYSQIEYRCFAHFAVGKGADEIRKNYLENPRADYHNATQERIKFTVGIDLERKLVKNINFGILYGLGVKNLAKDLNINVDEAQKLLDSYHKAIPYAKSTMKFYMKYAQDTGEIRTYLGRKTLFEEWEYNQYTGQPQRKGLYKSLNYLLQGSAADIMKIAMWTLYNEGIFEEVGYPSLTVHDELDFTDYGTPGGWKKVHEILEHCVELKVPIKADCEIGANWGEVEEIPSDSIH